MIPKIRPAKITASFVLAIISLSVARGIVFAQSYGNSTTQRTSASPQSLDYEFFKSRVEPIFLKKRPATRAAMPAIRVDLAPLPREAFSGSYCMDR